MKKFILRILLFLTILPLTYSMWLILWTLLWSSTWCTPNLKYIPGAYGHMQTRSNEVQKTSNIDILIVGSSHAYRGFNTEYFLRKGYRTFNLGSSAQTPLQTNILLKRYLKQLNPKLVIFEVYPETFTSDGIESSLDIISNDKIDLHNLTLILRQRHLTITNTLIWSLFQSHILNNNPIEPLRKDTYNDTYISGGFVQKDLSYFSPKEYKNKTWQWSKTQLNAFKKNIKLVRSQKIDYLLIQAPVTQSLYQSFKDIESFDTKMTEYGNYYNFNLSVELKDSLHFYDSNHLNSKGVELFNSEVLQLINSIAPQMHQAFMPQNNSPNTTSATYKKN